MLSDVESVLLYTELRAAKVGKNSVKFHTYIVPESCMDFYVDFRIIKQNFTVSVVGNNTNRLLPLSMHLIERGRAEREGGRCEVWFINVAVKRTSVLYYTKNQIEYL